MYFETVKEVVNSQQNKEALDDFEKRMYESFCEIFGTENGAREFAIACKNDTLRGLNIFADVFDHMVAKISGQCDVVKVAAAKCAAAHFVKMCDNLGNQLNKYDDFCDMFEGFATDCVSASSIMFDSSMIKKQGEGAKNDE